MNCFSATLRDQELQLKSSQARSIMARMDVSPPQQKPKQLLSIPYQEAEKKRAGSSEESEMYKLSLVNIAKKQKRDRFVSQEESKITALEDVSSSSLAFRRRQKQDEWLAEPQLRLKQALEPSYVSLSNS